MTGLIFLVDDLMKHVTFPARLRIVKAGNNFLGTSLPIYVCSYAFPLSPSLIYGIVQYRTTPFPQSWPSPTFFPDLPRNLILALRCYVSLEMLDQTPLSFVDMSNISNLSFLVKKRWHSSAPPFGLLWGAPPRSPKSVRTDDARTYGDAITRFSWLDGLPNFLRYGALSLRPFGPQELC